MQVYDELRKNDIAVNLHYIPVHRHPYYENLGFKRGDFPVAEKLFTLSEKTNDKKLKKIIYEYIKI